MEIIFGGGWVGWGLETQPAILCGPQLGGYNVHKEMWPTVLCGPPSYFTCSRKCSVWTGEQKLA